MRIAIYGAGSMGTVLGAFITKAGTPVDLINRNKPHVEALREKGAVIRGTITMDQPVTALTPDEMEGVYDIIFLMTKQQLNAEVVEFLKPYLADGGVICTLQNGLPEPDMAAALGEERVLGCSVAWGAMMTDPGVVEVTSDDESLTFSLGGLPGMNRQKLMEVKELLELMCPVILEENFIGGRWTKLLINSAFSGMSTVLGSNFGEAAGDKRSRVVVQKIIKECIDVSRAAGVTIAPVQGKDIAKLLDYSGAIKKKISFFLIPIAIKKHALIRASMLQDIEKGKKTEVDSINGVVCEFGRRYGVATPVNDKVVEIIHGIEDGKYKPSFDNLQYFGV